MLAEVFYEVAGTAPTAGQQKFITAFGAFITSTKPRCALLLRGYAGTGKTTLIASIVHFMTRSGTTCVLMAPTGRAAKVISAYSGKPAFTIHKLIYVRKTAKDGQAIIELRQNLMTGSLFIVDEASMIQAEHEAGGFSVNGSVLEDLIAFVYAGEGCRLMLSGDTAQLPPVGSTKSLALDAEWMRREFDLTVAALELTEVVRQEQLSDLLALATGLRRFIRDHQQGFRLKPGMREVFRINALELQEALQKEYDAQGMDNVLIITRTNKRANLYNQQVRGRILWMEEELCRGDRLVIVRNNYHWLRSDRGDSFIANGDTCEITKIRGEEEEYGLRFVNATLRFNDYDLEVEAKLVMDALMSEGPALEQQKAETLFEELKIAYAGERSRRAMFEKIRSDDHYNALQAKFAYAVTCHKAQGGQWPVVFVDQGYLTAEMIDREYYRWLYTAVTRATARLYLVNFDEELFGSAEA